MNYKIFVQIIGFIGTGFYFLSYQFKENKNLFRVQFVSYIFYTIHFILLGAFTGAACYAINILKCYFLSSDNTKYHEKKYCVLICLLQIIGGTITWGGYISLLPIVANVALTIGNYTFDPRKIRIIGLCINSTLWVTYNIIVGSLAGIVDEIVSMLSITVSLLRYKSFKKQNN